ncbi:stretch-activated Ca2+-permeable channel component-domain-containing protein [Aspergillus aurantiobrunneus]
MARVWIAASQSPMQRNIAYPRYRFGATVSLTILLAVLLTVIAPAFATVADPTPLTPEKERGRLIAKDDTPAGFSYFFGSFNGLVIDHEADETAETRGLDLVNRAPDSPSLLRNNRFEEGELSMGAVQHWSFSPSSEASNSVDNASDNQSDNTSKRASTTVYLSLTICSKPRIQESVSNAAQDLPQLAVYISTSNSLQRPGPGNDVQDQFIYPSKEGYMSATVRTESEVHIGVAAPENEKFIGSYSYQVAASTEGFFHGVHDEIAMLSAVDSGSNSALLYTANPTGQIVTEKQLKQQNNNTALYSIFINNANNTDVSGLSRSYCALEQSSQTTMGNNVQASMSTRTREDKKLQEQFYITGLNPSSTYVGILAMGNSTGFGNGIVGGGGKVWKPITFNTKADGNCDVIYDLDFCTDIAYAVPSNPSMDMSEIRTKYDNYAADLYKNFTYTLQQIQCNTSNETIFSMAVNCDDCANAYKSWLCAVTIPQCDDYSSTTNNTPVMVRNAAQPFPNGTKITNQTHRDWPVTKRPRNSGLIDTEIKPGPYKEILPSVKKCHELVRKCPMALGFTCPKGEYLVYSYNTNTGTIPRVPYYLWSVTMTFIVATMMLWVC